jgi:hypothetical protein
MNCYLAHGFNNFFVLAPTLAIYNKLIADFIPNTTVYYSAMLAQAVCKLEGFTYEPSDSVYWQHGHSTERDFIYVTTQNLSHDQLQALSDEVGEGRSLLVMCSAFRLPAASRGSVAQAGGKPDKVSQSHDQKDSQDRAHPLRMGP